MSSTAAGDTASQQLAGVGVSIDSGKSPVPQPNFTAGLSFKKQQLRQLRAQCLVFLAFRNGLIPKELHLEIALENIHHEEGKEQILHDGSSVSKVQVLGGVFS